MALATLLLSCAGTTGTRRGDRVDVSTYPPEIQHAYRVFEVRCSRCHTLARPLNANITDTEHWRRYVTRMRRTPGSGINPQNAEIILRFLNYYTKHEKGSGAIDDQPASPQLAPPNSPATATEQPSAPPPQGHEAQPAPPPPAAPLPPDVSPPASPAPNAATPLPDGGLPPIEEDQP